MSCVQFASAFAAPFAYCVCLSPLAVLADPPAPRANGVYRLVEEGAGVAVARASGGTLHLGELASSNLGPVEIYSTNDENTRFQFRFPKAGPLRGNADEAYAIWLGGYAEPVGSTSEPDGEGRRDLSCWFDGREVAEGWARTLGETLPSRTHPGYRLLTTFEPLRDEYRVGEKVELRMTIRNVGPLPFTFMDGGQQRGPRNNQFRFIAWKGYQRDFAVPDVGDRTNFGGIGAFVTLQQGETFEKVVELDRWFRFAEPGTYEITGLFEMEFLDPDAESYREIWHDFAAGTCELTIVAEEEPAQPAPSEGEPKP